ncbi:hypothetical protein M2302_000300 [Micromonospora sp. A200]|uniref:hypothetical protein n=1 Tax=Micromonospora sp. A200 TaxID=2940568 RepID=UPI002475F25B|nr:hypothetical protein [Micromonospora sp. A200]MDH6460149.1 hypothetical protein [Micromonospora sp. A200]
MSLDTLPLAIAGWSATRRHRRNTARGHRSDHTILRWPAQLRRPIADELAPAVNGVNGEGER